MERAATSGSAPRDKNINLRVSSRQRSLIDQAAEALGKTRSDFMLEASCKEAESVLLDKVHFQVGSKQFRDFLKQLDAPSPSDAKLRKLLRTKAPWEK